MIERLGSDYKVMKGAVTPDHEMKSDDDGTRLAASFYTPHTLTHPRPSRRRLRFTRVARERRERGETEETR